MWTENIRLEDPKHVHDQVLHIVRQLSLIHLTLTLKHSATQISQMHLNCGAANLKIDISIEPRQGDA
jgi:hypothetical protein